MVCKGYPRLVNRIMVCGALALGGMSLTGCQIYSGGQTLPSPYYLDDDVQYHPEGPEFKLSREAAAMKAAKQAADDATRSR